MAVANDCLYKFNLNGAREALCWIKIHLTYKHGRPDKEESL